jgi:hypothetical protein
MTARGAGVCGPGKSVGLGCRNRPIKNRPVIASSMASSGEPAKRKEIYTYCADWEIYGMSWTVRPEQRFR